MNLTDALKSTGRARRKATTQLNFGSGQVEGLAIYTATSQGGYVDLEFKGRHTKTRLMYPEERTTNEDWQPLP